MKRFRVLLVALLTIGAPVSLFVWNVHRYSLNEALFAAVRKKDTKQAISLLARGADPNYREPLGPRPPIWTLLRNRLLGRSDSSRSGPTLLHLLSDDQFDDNADRIGLPENLAVVNALIDHGASVNALDAEGNTPLLLAVGWGREATANLLVDRGADPDIADRDGVTPLQIEIGGNEGETPLALRLVDKVRDVNIGDKDGYTPLLAAASDQKPNIVAELLRRGADVNRADDYGYTALHIAAINDHAKLIRTLIDHGADWKRKCCTGDTPLSWARREKSKRAMKALLLAGAKY